MPWRSFPFYAISFLAGMQTIPLESTKPPRSMALTLAAVPLYYPAEPVPHHWRGGVADDHWTANAFEPIYLLTGGGPSDATTVYTMLVYVMGMVNLRLGEAAAVSVLFLPLLIGLVLVVTGLWQRRNDNA